MKFNKLSRAWKIGIALVGVLLLFKMFSSCSNSKTSLQAVRSVKVQQGDLVITVTATGTVKPYNRVEIKPPISGRVEEVLVREGENVKKGQVLAWMSSVERAALLDAARSRGPEAIQRWEEAYKPAPLLAPLDGTIIVRAVEPGQSVTTADPVVVLSDRLIAEALVDETDLSMIEPEQKTEIRLDAYPDELFLGKVYHITYESELVNNVNVYAVDILPEKVPPAFRSGMTANLTFIVKELKGVLLVPSEAVVEWPQGRQNPARIQFAVYKKTFGGKLEPVPVRIGASDGRMTEIIDGLKKGTEVVIVRKKERPQTGNPFSPRGAPKKNEAQRPS